MPFFYSSGEEIAKGDRVLLHGEPGEIELVADPAESPDDLLEDPDGRVINQIANRIGFDLKAAKALIDNLPLINAPFVELSRGTAQRRQQFAEPSRAAMASTLA